MTKSTIAGLTGLAIVLGSCGTSLGQEQPAAQPPAEKQDKPVPFETIKFRSKHKEKKQYVIRDEKEWEAVCRNAHPRWLRDGLARKYPLPPVDFEKEMVLAAFQGTCSNTGYSVQIEAVRDAGDKLIAVVKQRTRGPWQAAGAMVTYPSHVIRVPKSDKPICFQVMTIKHPERSRRESSGSPIDPDIYKELKYSPDGKAKVLILLKDDGIPEDLTWEKRKDMGKKINRDVLQVLSPDDFEALYNSRWFLDLRGRISARGLEKLSKHAYFQAACFLGPFSLPEEFVIEQQCE